MQRCTKTQKCLDRWVEASIVFVSFLSLKDGRVSLILKLCVSASDSAYGMLRWQDILLVNFTGMKGLYPNRDESFQQRDQFLNSHFRLQHIPSTRCVENLVISQLQQNMSYLFLSHDCPTMFRYFQDKLDSFHFPSLWGLIMLIVKGMDSSLPNHDGRRFFPVKGISTSVVINFKFSCKRYVVYLHTLGIYNRPSCLVFIRSLKAIRSVHMVWQLIATA